MQNKKSLGYIFLAFVAGMLLMYLFNNYKIEKKKDVVNSEILEQNSSKNKLETSSEQKSNISLSAQNIDELTQENIVIPYIKKHGELPDYYITKSEAKSLGWVPSKGNLCEVAPRKAIGGDIWTNRQKSLPTKSGRRYFEADLNFNCGNRNADRVVFSNDGLVFVTHDHYKNFEEK